VDEPTLGQYAARALELTHYTVIADGVLDRFVPGHTCQPGPAMLGLKVWATSALHAASVAQQVGGHVGFTLSGRAEIYKTAPAQPSGGKPCGYDLQLTAYDPEPNAGADQRSAEPGDAADGPRL
jgi:hypothetical protein